VADGVLRLDTRHRPSVALQSERCGLGLQGHSRRALGAGVRNRRLQGESATLKKELLARGLPVPGAPTPSGEPELKLPSDADVDKMILFLEKFWRRLLEMVTTVQKGR
jgi:hypothetical protein